MAVRNAPPRPSPLCLVQGVGESGDVLAVECCQSCRSPYSCCYDEGYVPIYGDIYLCLKDNILASLLFCLEVHV